MRKTVLSFLLLSLGIGQSLAQVEPGAGQWKTWFITSGKDYRLPPPNAFNTKEEIKTVASLQGRLDAAGLQAIQYWNAGAPTYRWRELLLALSTRDTARPSIFVLMLLNTAVYDATVAAWETRYAYQRQRPFEKSKVVKAFVPKPESPSYPCEHSVAAGVAVALARHFYPQKADSVLQLAQQAMQSRVAAGVVYPSDTKAGFELGQQIAALAIEKTKACAPAARWDGKIPAEPGLWKGKNPVGPVLGSWKPMVLTAGNQLRPAPPPDYKKDMEELRAFKPTFRSTANAFFYAQHDYWRELTDQKIFEYHLDQNPPLAAQIYALRSIAVYDGAISCWDAKYTYWGTRPDQYDTTYRPVLMSTPNFPGYPSGHATMDGLSAVVLSYFFPAEKAFFWQKAKEAAESRFEGGVHFRTDNEVGLEMGRKVAELVLQKANPGGGDQAAGRTSQKRKD